ncbi:MAG TPA: hypothetical protein VMT52_00280, partial [Planctomycetota bacterium]|nr:hypothetical protein [Planctomycetota bacterium]
MARKLNALGRAEPVAAFYPVACEDYLDLLRPNRKIPPDSHAIHLWRTVFVRTGIPTDATYPPTSIVGQLQRRYG